MNERKLISIMIIIMGIALFCCYHIYYHFVSIAKENIINKYQEKEIIEDSIIPVDKISNNKSTQEEYLGILTIPKINLKEVFYKKDSNKNNVSNNVTILSESISPELNGSIVYLAAHSGSGHLAYFKNIDKLTNDDMIYLNYNNKTYSYVITDIYELARNGNIIVNHNINEKYLILTTCSKHDNMQLVIKSKMLNKI